jgi:hypothetical protein
MRQSELAKAWGMSKGQISKYVKAGMPLTSESAAQQWRRDNQKNVTKGLLAEVRQEARLEVKVESPEGNHPAKEVYERARTAERKSYELMNSQVDAKSFIQARAAIAQYNECIKALNNAAEGFRQEQAHLRQTLSTAEVKEKYIKHIGSLRSLLDAMPSSLCARANPSDPECAKQALEEGVNQLYIAIQKGEGAFG